MIPLLDPARLREVDDMTLRGGSITALDLMERAASRCVDRFLALYPAPWPIHVLAGMGNNGGDGVVMARLLHELGRSVRVTIVPHRHTGSPEFAANILRLQEAGIQAAQYVEGQYDELIQPGEVVIDALLGNGLSRPVTGMLAEVVQALVRSGVAVVSIDRPSGWPGAVIPDRIAVRATHTFILEAPEYRMLLPDEAPFIGRMHVLPIGLDREAFLRSSTSHYLLEPSDAADLLPARPRAGHKGTFGHGLLMAGGPGKMGAAILAAQAALHSGSGLITMRVIAGSEALMHAKIPEALLSVDPHGGELGSMPDLAGYSAIGIGPGIGTAESTARLLKHLIQDVQVPLVLDADAINLLALNPTWVAFLPSGSILTPHPKEFDRLAGPSAHAEERLEKARRFAQRNKVVLVLKGAYTAICTPGGRVLFNPTGNAGMAKGGSGDVLTGIVTGLCAQGLPTEAAAVLGVFAHGYAGDLAAAVKGEQGMLPTDLIAELPAAWERIRAGR